MIDHILKMSQEQHRIVTIMYQGEQEITQRNICVFSMDDEKVKAMCYLRHQPRVNCLSSRHAKY
ncbi:MAG: hypothetical protein ACYDG2_08745 [Ruminiclostridium sp.]